MESEGGGNAEFHHLFLSNLTTVRSWFKCVLILVARLLAFASPSIVVCGPPTISWSDASGPWGRGFATPNLFITFHTFVRAY